MHRRVILRTLIIGSRSRRVILETVGTEKPIRFLEDSVFSWSEFKRGEYLRPVAACNFPLLFQRGVLICARAVSGLERPQSNDDPEIGYFNTSVRGDVSFPAAGIAPYLPTRSNLGQSSSNRAYGSFRCREMKGIPSLNSRINLLHSLGHIRFEKSYSARPRDALSVRREPMVQATSIRQGSFNLSNSPQLRGDFAILASEFSQFPNQPLFERGCGGNARQRVRGSHGLQLKVIHVRSVHNIDELNRFLFFVL
jgi:hypothetical protein